MKDLYKRERRGRDSMYQNGLLSCCKAINCNKQYGGGEYRS